MRTGRYALLTAAICTAGAAFGQGGLQMRVTETVWASSLPPGAAPLAARLDITALRLGDRSLLDPWGPTPMAASIGGDYYFSKDLAEPGSARTGFRASSALLIRQPGISLSELAWSSRSMASFGVPVHATLPGLVAADASSYSVSTMPYLGIGYSGMVPKSGWGYWADIGLVMQSPGNLLGFGRVMSGAQGIDDLMRDLRLAPMVQLGVNYSF